MANRKFWLGMLVMALAFGMMVVGCDAIVIDDGVISGGGGYEGDENGGTGGGGTGGGGSGVIGETNSHTFGDWTYAGTLVPSGLQLWTTSCILSCPWTQSEYR